MLLICSDRAVWASIKRSVDEEELFPLSSRSLSLSLSLSYRFDERFRPANCAFIWFLAKRVDLDLFGSYLLSDTGPDDRLHRLPNSNALFLPLRYPGRGKLARIGDAFPEELWSI